MACGTRINLETGVIERLSPHLGDPCRMLAELETPPRRLYVRVNTLKVSVEEYLDLAAAHGYRLYVDEEIPEALWAPVEGPMRPRRYPGRVVADKRAAESVLMGSDLYAPGVVMVGGFSRGDMVSVYSENGVHVGSGIAFMNPEEMVKSRRGLAVRVVEPVWRSYRVHDLPGYREGLIYGQSISSMYVAHLLEPEPGDRIVDMTAAPGGKISHVVQLAGGRVEAVAVDRPSKEETLRETLSRLSMDRFVRVIGGDSRRLTRIYPSLRSWASKVIVDPPCTNIGVRPKVYERRTRRDVRNAALYQRSILYEAVKVAAPGGLIAYSTCTLTVDENDSNVAWASDVLGLEVVVVKRFMRPRLSGIGHWFSPLDGIPGFYVAILRKPG